MAARTLLMEAAALLPSGVLMAAAATLTSSPPSAGGAAPPPAIFGPNVRADAGERDTAGQGEPQVTVDAGGITYVSWMGSNGGEATAASRTVDGLHFDYLGAPMPLGIGDVVLATTTRSQPDRVQPAPPAGADGLFWGNVGVGRCGAAQAIVASSLDRGQSWTPSPVTCQPVQVDRDWLAAFTPAAFRGTAAATSHTVLYDEYHDFLASGIWVNRSLDGGATWDPAPHLAMQPGSAAMLTSLCNTIPGGIAVDQRGRHAGRVYAVWSSSDPPESAAGCNVSQGSPFDHVFVSFSDDQGATWSSHAVFNDPCAPDPPDPPAPPGIPTRPTVRDARTPRRSSRPSRSTTPATSTSPSSGGTRARRTRSTTSGWRSRATAA